MKILVIPSVREDCLKKFLTKWQHKGDWDSVILIEDNPERTFHVEVDYHFSWKEIEEILGESSWIISKKDSAIRTFGFLIAYRQGAEYILTLDDDCLPWDDHIPLFKHHIENLTKPKWSYAIPGKRTRGLPYHNLGTLKNVVANMGLWTNIADYDAITSLNAEKEFFIPPKGNYIVPAGQFVPISGMNLCFKRLATPLFYFPLMGQNYPFSRFDDIWAGIIAKKIIDHLGWHICIGEPFIEHEKASNVFTNLVKESPGIKRNETFWEDIEKIKLTKISTIECIEELGLQLKESNDDYLCKLGEALITWSKLFI